MTSGLSVPDMSDLRGFAGTNTAASACRYTAVNLVPGHPPRVPYHPRHRPPRPLGAAHSRCGPGRGPRGVDARPAARRDRGDPGPHPHPDRDGEHDGGPVGAGHRIRGSARLDHERQRRHGLRAHVRGERLHTAGYSAARGSAAELWQLLRALEDERLARMPGAVEHSPCLAAASASASADTRKIRCGAGPRRPRRHHAHRGSGPCPCTSASADRAWAPGRPRRGNPPATTFPSRRRPEREAQPGTENSGSPTALSPSGHQHRRPRVAAIAVRCARGHAIPAYAEATFPLAPRPSSPATTRGPGTARRTCSPGPPGSTRRPSACSSG